MSYRFVYAQSALFCFVFCRRDAESLGRGCLLFPVFRVCNILFIPYVASVVTRGSYGGHTVRFQ